MLTQPHQVGVIRILKSSEAGQKCCIFTLIFALPIISMGDK